MRSLSPARFVTALAAAAVFLAVLFAMGGEKASADDAKIATMTVEQLNQRLSQKGDKPLVVDVREQNEYDEIHIDGVVLAPLATVEQALASTPKDREIVLVCRSGRRSAKAYQALSARGFTNMKNLEGGMIAWEKAGYPAVKKGQ